MSCPTNCVSASLPRTSWTLNMSLMCILLKSPVMSCTVTSVVRPMTFVGSSAGVSPITWRLNISGARRLNQPFAFHLSFTFRAEVRDCCFAIVEVLVEEVRIKPFGRGSSPEEARVHGGNAAIRGDMRRVRSFGPGFARFRLAPRTRARFGRDLGVRLYGHPHVRRPHHGCKEETRMARIVWAAVFGAIALSAAITLVPLADARSFRGDLTAPSGGAPFGGDVVGDYKIQVHGGKTSIRAKVDVTAMEGDTLEGWLVDTQTGY